MNVFRRFLEWRRESQRRLNAKLVAAEKGLVTLQQILDEREAINARGTARIAELHAGQLTHERLAELTKELGADSALGRELDRRRQEL